METTILIVDGMEEMRLLISNAIVELMGETYKFQFLLAKNAEEAQRLMHYKRVDLVITDHRMPGITGTELILWIKKNHPEVPIILMSSDAENPIHQADGFLTKPLNIFLLEKLITELLAVPV